MLQNLRGLGPQQLAVMGAVAIILMGLIVFGASRLANRPMELLYGDLAPSDAQSIVSRLESDNIPFELRRNGTEILVPADQVHRLRLATADVAQYAGGSKGYRLFDEGNTLGSTSFEQQVSLVRAMEGELASTIRSIEGVKAARVHLVLPRRETFSRETQAPKASVVVRMQSGRLNSGQALAIQQLVAGAVPMLQPNSVTILDERGTLVGRGFENGPEMAALRHEEMRMAEERRLANAIEDMLSRALGPGKVRAEVRAEMDFDKVATTEEIYDPESVVVRSTVTVEEQASTNEREPQPVTVGQNLPADAAQAQANQATSNESRAEETVNNEISKRVVNQVREGGRIRRLSVAVMVDGSYQPQADGTRTYQPRSAEQMAQLTALVQSAVGFSADRGDQIEVRNLQFLDPTIELPEFDEFEFMGLSKQELLEIGKQLGVFIVAILVIFLIVRPLVSRALEAPAAGSDAARRLLTAEGLAAPQLPGPIAGVPVPGALGDDMELTEDLIDIDKVEGRVKASSLRKIGEIVEKHPEEALSIIRNWLYQDA